MAEPATIRAALLELAERRGLSATFCPSEVARAIDAENWRPLMEPVRAEVSRLARDGRIGVFQAGHPVDPDSVRGPIRLGLVRR